MRIEKALEVLHFQPEGRLKKIKVDVFNRRSAAEKAWRISATTCTPEQWDIVQADHDVLLAWECLTRFWCSLCGCVVIQSHFHCPDCGVAVAWYGKEQVT